MGLIHIPGGGGLVRPPDGLLAQRILDKWGRRFRLPPLIDGFVRKAAVTHVQTIKTVDNDGGNFTTTNNFTVTAGNALLVFVVAADNVNTPVINSVLFNGNAGTPFVVDKSVTNTVFAGAFDAIGAIASRFNVSGAGPQTVQVNYANTVVTATVWVMEVSGLASATAQDGTGASFQGTPTGADAATPVFKGIYNDDFWFAGIGHSSGANPATVTAGTGWTIPTNGSETNGAANQVGGVEYIANPDAQNGIAHFTINGGEQMVFCAMAYKSATAGIADGIYYSTSFGTTENPISEGGRWRGGLAQGISWTNARVTAGQAWGTETGSGGFDDSIAILRGQWLPDQQVVARVKTINQTLTCNQEIELFLRGSCSPKCLTGYEVQFSARGGSLSGSAYLKVVRWNGALGDFTELSPTTLTGPGLNDGDEIKATIDGSAPANIRVYVNGTLINTWTDSTWTDGQPGFGFFIDTGVAASTDFGLTRWQFGTPLPGPAIASPVPIQIRMR